MNVPNYYRSLHFSPCGGICAGYSSKESKIIVAKHNYLLREIDVYPFTSQKKETWEAAFRIEKHYIRAALYTPDSTDKELHVTISLKDDCWDVHFDPEVVITTDSSCSDNGSVFVQQFPSRQGVRYTFNHNQNHTLEVPCTDVVPNEPLFMLSAPCGSWVYLKLLQKLYVPKTRTFLSVPFEGMLEWMDDTHSVVCVETLTGFRELWQFTPKKNWRLVKRIHNKLHINGLPVRCGLLQRRGVCVNACWISAVYELLGSTIMRNREYHMMVPPNAQIFFGREFYTVRANEILHFHRII